MINAWEVNNNSKEILTTLGQLHSPISPHCDSSYLYIHELIPKPKDGMTTS